MHYGRNILTIVFHFPALNLYRSFPIFEGFTPDPSLLFFAENGTGDAKVRINTKWFKEAKDRQILNYVFDLANEGTAADVEEFFRLRLLD